MSCLPANEDTGPPSKVRRLVFLTAALFLAVQVSPLYYAQGDAPGYLSIARHIARGDGLMNRGSQVLWYPPGYPLLISPLFIFGELPLLAISIAHFLLAMALMAGVYQWAKRFAPDAAVWVAAIVVGTAAFTVFFRRPMSELAFVTASIWATVCVERALIDPRWPRFLGYALAATLLLSASTLIRSIGIAFAAGAGARIGLAALKGRISWPRAIGFALPAVLAPLAIMAAVTLRDRAFGHAHGEDTYLTVIAEQTNPILKGHLAAWFSVVVNEVGRVSIPGMWNSYAGIGVWWDVNSLIYLPYVLFLAYGWLRWVRRGNDTFASTVPFYFAVLTYCRFESGARYWLPMTPAIVVSAWFALEALGRRRQALFAAIWALHLAAASVFWLARDLPITLAINARLPEAKEAALIVRDRDNDRVCVAEEDNGLGYMLALLLDRRVEERAKGGGDVPPRTRWLILPDKASAPPGFSRHSRLGKDVLWQRD